MKRNREIVLAAHCMLNVNAKVEGIAKYPAASRIASELMDMGIGIIQLPCVEQAMFGMRRWGIVHEQCDFPAFRAKCRELLTPVVDQAEDFISCGYTIRAVIGMDGSPTCGVKMRAAGDWYGEVGYEYDVDRKIRSAHLEEGPGTMMDVLTEMLEERGLDIPFCALNEAEDDLSAAELLEQVM